MKRLFSLVLSSAFLVMLTSAQTAVERQGQSLSIGTGYLSTTKLVKSGSTVTAGHAVKIDSATPANQVIECATSDVEFLGIAAATVVGDGILTVEVVTRGVIAAVPENNTTIGHIAGIGTTSAGQLKDLGQTSSSSVSIGLKIIGKWLAAVVANGTTTASLQLYGPGHFGSQVQAADVPAAATVFGTGTLTVPAGNYVIAGCTSTCTVPVPVPVAGYQICVKNNAGVATVITLSALGSSAMYPKADDSGYGTAGTGTMVSTAAAGNKVCLIGHDSTHYELGAVNASANWTVN